MVEGCNGIKPIRYIDAPQHEQPALSSTIYEVDREINELRVDERGERELALLLYDERVSVQR